MVRSYLADVLEHLTLSSTYYVHHVLIVAPFLALLQNLLEKALAFLVLCELEVVATLVAGQSQKDDPLAFILEEWLDRILAHVRSYGYRIEIVLLEESLGIHLGCVADISTLGICDDEVVWIVALEILDGVLEGDHAVDTTALVESQVWLVSHTVRSGCVDDSLVELKHHLCFCALDFLTLCDALRQLIDICIKTYAQETLLGENLLYKFFSVHFFLSYLNFSWLLYT